MTSSVLLIRGDSGNTTRRRSSRPRPPRRHVTGTADMPALQFTRHENQYRLLGRSGSHRSRRRSRCADALERAESVLSLRLVDGPATPDADPTPSTSASA